jgi:endonuclease I
MLLLLGLAGACGPAAGGRELRTFGSTPVAGDDYYADAADWSGVLLKNRLHEIIRRSSRLNYNQVAAVIRETDEDPRDPDRVIMIYTGRSLRKSALGAESDAAMTWNREHVWAKSRGFPRVNMPAHTDLHHIRPCEVEVNRVRGDMIFGELQGSTPVADAPGAFVDAARGVFQPPPDAKGDVARMLLYMDVRYQGDADREPDLRLVDTVPVAARHGVDQQGNGYFGNVRVLLRWHAEDPVSEQERQRNERIFRLQGNRNPFIDHPEFASAIYRVDARQ